MVDYFQERGFNTMEDADRSREEELQRHIMRLLADFSLFDEMGLPHELPPPASAEAVSKLPEKKITEDCCGRCDICLKDYEKNEIIKIIPCKHKYHSECIMAWLAKTNSCPLCRYELPTDDPIYEQYRKEKIRQKEREADIETLHNSMFS